MNYREATDKVAKQLGLPAKFVCNVYRAYWKFIKDTIEQFPLKDELSKEDFDKLRLNFNVPSLGKLCCTYDRYCGIKITHKKLKELYGKDFEDKETETTVQSNIDNS